MSRTIDSMLAAEFDKAELAPIFMLEMETDGGTVYAWTGIGDLVYGGNTYKGTGILGGFERVEETLDNAAVGNTYILNGVESDIAAAAISDIRQGLEATLYLAALDANGKIVGTPLLIDRGFTDVPELEDDSQTATIRITTESKAIDRQRPRVRRYTTEDQKIDNPNDRGFEYVEGLQDRKIKWGRS